MNKGVVMQMDPKHVIVMTPDGQFKRVPRRHRNCRVGEEIDLPSGSRFSFSARASRYISIAAAAVILFFSLAGLFGGGQSAAAYVTLDVNPSVEMGINAQEKVIEVQGLNKDGQRVVQSLHYKGRPLKDVTHDLIVQIMNDKYLSVNETDIVITSTVVNSRAHLNETAIADSVKRQVSEIIQQNPEKAPKKLVVAAIPVPQQVRDAAKKEGISTGKLAVKLFSENSKQQLQIDNENSPEPSQTPSAGTQPNTAGKPKPGGKVQMNSGGDSKTGQQKNDAKESLTIGQLLDQITEIQKKSADKPGELKSLLIDWLDQQRKLEEKSKIKPAVTEHKPGKADEQKRQEQEKQTIKQQIKEERDRNSSVQKNDGENGKSVKQPQIKDSKDRQNGDKSDTEKSLFPAVFPFPDGQFNPIDHSQKQPENTPGVTKPDNQKEKQKKRYEWWKQQEKLKEAQQKAQQKTQQEAERKAQQREQQREQQKEKQKEQQKAQQEAQKAVQQESRKAVPNNQDNQQQQQEQDNENRQQQEQPSPDNETEQRDGGQYSPVSNWWQMLWGRN